MTPNQFRKLALAFPDTVEGSHMNHPDFRVRGKIFATLGPDESWGMVKLPRDRQAALVEAQPEVFQPFNGSWGRQGCTKVVLELATTAGVRDAIVAAWRGTAPKALVEHYDASISSAE